VNPHSRLAGANETAIRAGQSAAAGRPAAACRAGPPSPQFGYGAAGDEVAQVLLFDRPVRTLLTESVALFADSMHPPGPSGRRTIQEPL